MSERITIPRSARIVDLRSVFGGWRKRDIAVRLVRRPTHIESAPLPVSSELANDERKEGTAAMKNQAIQYLALDVHQATSVATVRDESGSVRMRATVATEAAAIIGLVKGLGPG